MVVLAGASIDQDGKGTIPCSYVYRAAKVTAAVTLQVLQPYWQFYVPAVAQVTHAYAAALFHCPPLPPDQAGDKTANGLTYIPPAKPKLPGHEESYNPPKEYIPAGERLTRRLWQK